METTLRLDETDLAELTAWRRALHRAPELSGHEVETAEMVRAMLAATAPDRLISGLGGHGVAAVYDGAEAGPGVVLRAELDALPIAEVSDLPHRSRVPGRAHLCGHDGHMATLAAVARTVGRRRPLRGRVVLLFQPAEEDGSGAAAVLADPRFAQLAPDFAFALHNMPGLPLGQAALVAGPAACASRGMRISLRGRTAHAARPDQGVSPVGALASLLPALAALNAGSVETDDLAMATVTYLRAGEAAFGIAPGEAALWVTLRTLTDARMAALAAEAERLARDAGLAEGVDVAISHADVFEHCENHPQAVEVLRRAMRTAGVPCAADGLPMLASEDFGRFGKAARAALFLLGSGEDHPGLHNPDFDFPDALIGTGARVFLGVLDQLLGFEAPD
jgi:amidohydrolase